jgi:hypothetical protein
MKKDNEPETKNLGTDHIENSGIELDRTDVGTFLGKIARRLTKEGGSLEVLADKWFDEGESRDTVRSFGADIAILGEQLLAIRNQICQTCQLKPVNITMNFNPNND